MGNDWDSCDISIWHSRGAKIFYTIIFSLEDTLASPFFSLQIKAIVLLVFHANSHIFVTMYKRSLFIFRQDLRLSDNSALIEAVKFSEEVFPIFIHDIRAIDDFGLNDPRFGFIREALESIDD